MSVFRDAFEQCPRCGVDLIDARSARGCRRCSGMWLREDVLIEMVMAMLPPSFIVGRLEFRAIAEGKRIACPSCHDPMDLAMLHGVVVDRCAKHGVWFDAKELQDVLQRSAAPDAPSVLVEVEVRPPLPPRRPPPPPPRPEPEPRPGIPTLLFRILRGDELSEVVLRREIIKIGRDPRAHVRLADDSGAARMHVVIDATSTEEVAIIDLGSEAGTLVNGEPVNKAPLHDGDVISIGDTTIVIEILP